MIHMCNSTLWEGSMSQVSKIMAPNVTSTTYHVQDCKESGIRIPSQEHAKPDTGTEEVREKERACEGNGEVSIRHRHGYHGYGAHLTRSTEFTALLTLCRCPLLSTEGMMGVMERILAAFGTGDNKNELLDF